MQNYLLNIQSPVGKLSLRSNRTHLLCIHFGKENIPGTNDIPEILLQAKQELDEYFAGFRKVFDLKINMEGSEFQKKTWKLVEKIPYGETITYRGLALRLGSEKYTRAVGFANAQNKFPIIVPCHRVIGERGKLTGYSGGLEIKKWLLLHEQIFEPQKDLFHRLSE